MSRDGKSHRCAWCGCIGHHHTHNQSGVVCHVAVEGRREADDADRLACELTRGVRSRRELRALLATRLRSMRIGLAMQPEVPPWL